MNSKNHVINGIPSDESKQEFDYLSSFSCWLRRLFINKIALWGVLISFFASIVPLTRYVMDLEFIQADKLNRAEGIIIGYTKNKRWGNDVYWAIRFYNQSAEKKFCYKWVQSAFDRECIIPLRSAKSFEYLDLAQVELDGVDLSKADLKRTILERAKFRKANLTGANLHSADLTRAELDDANLTDADLRRATLTRAELDDANLTDADLRRATLTRAELDNANLTDADLRKAMLQHADMIKADLTNAKLDEADFLKADLKGATFDNTSVSGVMMKYAKNMTKDQLKGTCVSRSWEQPGFPEDIQKYWTPISCKK